MKLKLLDLFCGEGGAGEGYRLAGFDVTGVDIVPQPRYKPGRFIQADAFDYLADHGHEYDVIHASPKCQAHSRTWHIHKNDHPDQITPLRPLLVATGKPYIIENVPGAPLFSSLVLCGSMFQGLRVIRHRLFETSPVIWIPPGPCACRHWFTNSGHGQRSAFSHGASAICVAGNDFAVEDGRLAMGIHWMTREGLKQAIPPAYTEWLGRKMLWTLGVVTPV